MKYSFRPINPKEDSKLCKEFFADAHRISGQNHFANPDNIEKYLKAVISKQERDPRFCSLLLENDIPIGLVDAFTMKNKPEIGFVSFYYIISEKRQYGIKISVFIFYIVRNSCNFIRHFGIKVNLCPFIIRIKQQSELFSPQIVCFFTSNTQNLNPRKIFTFHVF